MFVWWHTVHNTIEWVKNSHIRRWLLLRITNFNKSHTPVNSEDIYFSMFKTPSFDRHLSRAVLDPVKVFQKVYDFEVSKTGVPLVIYNCAK